MPRSKKIFKKLATPDPVYGNRLLGKFINKVMRDGKKGAAAKQVYEALKSLETKNPGEGEPVKTFETAIQTVAPRMEVRPRRVGGASYQIPVEVRGERKVHLAMRWLIDAARARSNKQYHTFAEKLAAEITDVLAGQGGAIKKRDQVHKMAEANKAFAHFRW